MPYTVTASEEVQDQLASLWLEASDRDAVSVASNQIDQVLRTAPLTHGTDLGEFRIYSTGPLTVAYTVSPDDCRVTILRFYYHDESHPT